jgi:hypothetical protein
MVSSCRFIVPTFCIAAIKLRRPVGRISKAHPAFRAVDALRLSTLQAMYFLLVLKLLLGNRHLGSSSFANSGSWSFQDIRSQSGDWERANRRTPC